MTARSQSRSRRLLVAILSGVAGRVVAALAPLLVMAPMLGHLGPVLFGTWLMATSVAVMATVLDFGVGLAANTRLSEAFGRDDLPAVRRTLGEVYTALGVICAGFSALLALGYALSPWVFPEAHASGQVAIVAVILLALLLSFPASVSWRLFQARHDFVQAQVAQVAGPLVGLGTCLGSIAAGLSPVAVTVVYALTNPFVLILWSGVHFLRHPAERPDFSAVGVRALGPLMSMSGAFFLLSIFTLVGMNVDNVLIAALAGAEVVAEYGVPARLASVLMLIVGTVFMPLWPLFSDALARHDHAWLRKTVLRMSLGGAAAILLAGVLMTVASDLIMQLWMGRSFQDQHLILLGWAFASTVIAATAPYNMILNAAGQAAAQLAPWIAFVVVSLTAKVLLVNPDTAWTVPWVTGAVYMMTIAPRMIWLARQRLLPADT